MSGPSSDFLRDLFEFGVDARARRVFLQTWLGAADDRDRYSEAQTVIRGLLFLDRTSGPIELWINSEGGDTHDALAIYDVMHLCSNPVHTIGHGRIMSAAGLLLAGGTGTRYVTENAVFMYHEGDGELTSASIELQRIQLAERERAEEQWARLMGRHTRPKKSGKFWRELVKAKPEEYLDARGMVTHGVADEIWVRDEKRRVR